MWRHRRLIAQLTWREVEGRYKASFLGFAWSFVNPLVLLVLYTFVFGAIFKARWPEAPGAGLSTFGLVLFAGLVAFNILGESIHRAPTLILAVPNYVKRTIFPLEVLAVSAVGSALFHAAASMVILVLGVFALRGALHWTLLLAPLALLPIVFLSLGVVWVVSSIGVFVRDMAHPIGLVVQVLLFLTPIFYPVESVPANVQPIVVLNPLTSIVQNFRGTVLWGAVPGYDLFFWLAATAIMMVFGYAWFMKTANAFADVM